MIAVIKDHRFVVSKIESYKVEYSNYTIELVCNGKSYVLDFYDDKEELPSTVSYLDNLLSRDHKIQFLKLGRHHIRLDEILRFELDRKHMMIHFKNDSKKPVSADYDDKIQAEQLLEEIASIL